MRAMDSWSSSILTLCVSTIKCQQSYRPHIQAYMWISIIDTSNDTCTCLERVRARERARARTHTHSCCLMILTTSILTVTRGSDVAKKQHQIRRNGNLRMTKRRCQVRERNQMMMITVQLRKGSHGTGQMKSTKNF